MRAGSNLGKPREGRAQGLRWARSRDKTEAGLLPRGGAYGAKRGGTKLDAVRDEPGRKPCDWAPLRGRGLGVSRSGYLGQGPNQDLRLGAGLPLGGGIQNLKRATLRHGASECPETWDRGSRWDQIL